MFWTYPKLTLQIEPTRRCNLSCKICMRRNLNETSGLLSLKDFKKVLNSWNFQHVALHGWGEPLLNPELFQMVKYAASQGISTELTTNGTLLKTNMERIFASGLSIIAFGMHNKENLPVVKPQIKELVTQRNRKKLRKPRVYIDIVIYRENQNQIADLVEAAGELNIDAIVFHRVFNPTTSFLDFASKCSESIFGETYPVDIKSNHSTSRVNIYKVDTDVGYISIQEETELFVKVEKLARKANMKLYLPPEPSIPCRAVKHSIFVTSGGNVTPCPYLPEFYMGDVFNGGLRDDIYWQRHRNFVGNMRKHHVCSRCPLGSINGNFYS